MTIRAMGTHTDPPPDGCRPVPMDTAEPAAQWVAETTVKSCDGHAFVMRRTGRGSPVMLLHDMGATQRDWDAVAQVLSATHSVCTWDARGHGISRGTPEAAVPTLGLLAADLAAAVAACSPAAPVLVGHALGALTILEYLRNHGAGDVARVVLVDQSPRMLGAPDWTLGLFGGFGAADAWDFEARLRNDFAEAWLRLHGCGFNARARAEYEGNSRRVDAQRSDLRLLANGSMLTLWRSQLSRDFRTDFATFPLPLLTVLGGESNLYDTAQLARWIAATVPETQVVRYEAADHAPHVAAPARFARDVAAFAARRAPVARHQAQTVPMGHARRPGTGNLARPMPAGVAA
jgi:non-heme chloroperoxidase